MGGERANVYLVARAAVSIATVSHVVPTPEDRRLDTPHSKREVVQ
jgi:hypothetical protein